MSKFAFMVYVETDRDSGLIASRDEQSERISDELERIGDYVDLSGIGARSDSNYSIANVDVWEMSKKDEKEANEEYERTVREAAPPKDELLVELEAARADAAKYKSLYETQKGIVDKLLESPEFKETRIWTEDRSGGNKVRSFLPDGRYDRVHFGTSEDGDDNISVGFDQEGHLEVRYNAMGKQLAVIPRSGNEVTLAVIDRRL